LKNYLFISLFSLLFAYSYATTTSGIVVRNVNVSDGFVEAGNIPTSNSSQGQWETDERFEGFNSIINWFLTWDDNNLYVGKIGGNNAQGSLIFIRANYDSSNYSNQGIIYDGFNPDFTLMNGINFTGYIKDSYDEFRTFDTAWSNANYSLNPAFGNYADGNHMEVSIPWNAITNGHGKPQNMRVVFYQVDNTSSSCSAQSPNPFLYAESPWGTGALNNGPSIGVNDGQALSNAQPGGCGNGGALIQRWWGCYPVIGGVGANGYVAVQPNAGADINRCSNSDTITLAANEPAADAIGTWSLVSAPINASPQFSNIHQKNTQLSGLNIPGEYILVWNINYGACPALPDTLLIHVWEALNSVNAGTDQLLPCGSNTAILAADSINTMSNYSGGIGYWTSSNASILFSDSSSYHSHISNMPFGETKMIWHGYNIGCSERTDTMSIENYAPVNAISIDTLRSCGNSIQLSANDANQFQNTAIGDWSLNSGNSTYNISNSHDANAVLSNLAPGNFAFEWKLINGNCPADSSETFVIVYPNINAGSDSTISLCNQSSFSIDAINPANIHPSVYGQWAILSNQNINLNTQNYQLNLDSLNSGEYIFQWKLSNGYCAADSANYTILNFAQAHANAGKDTTLCSISNFNLYANNPLNIENSAQGQWSILFGNGNINNPNAFNSSLSNFINGELQLLWKVSNGICIDALDTIRIKIAPIVDAQVAGNINVCDSNEVQLNATPIQAGVGSWELLSGSTNLIISDLNNPISSIQNLDVDTTTLQWKVIGYCNRDSATVVIKNFQKPQSMAGPNASICKSEYELMANTPLNIAASASGLWKVMSGDAGISIENPTSYHSKLSNLLRGDYVLRWTVKNGVCEDATSDIALHVNELFGFGIITKNSGDNEKYTGELHVGKPFYAVEPYQLSIDSKQFTNDSIFDSLSVGKHFLQLLDFTGCLIDTVIEIKPKLFVPTGISPNGDGANDTWKILGIEEYSGSEIRVYNLWGQKIFESISQQEIFDGTYQGGKLPDGDYYYIIDLKDGSELLKGKLTVLR
jgi:gliding motility-associated-like protein